MDQLRGRNFKVSAVQWHLFSDDQFYIGVDQRRYFRWAGFILQNSTQERAWLGDGEVRQWVYFALWPQFSSVDSKTFMTSLLLTERLHVAVVFMWEKKMSLEFHMSKQVLWCTRRSIISRHVQQFISFLVFNTMFIIKHAPEFIFFLQAVGQ